MNSSVSKVMHKIAERPALGYILETSKKIDASNIILVTSPSMGEVRKFAENQIPEVIHAIQENQLGTADAVRAALSYLPKTGRTIILYGDTPFVSEETLKAINKNNKDICLVGFNAKDANQYGRLITSGSNLLAIVEEKEATDEERKISLCNSGIYSIRNEILFSYLPLIKNENLKKEYYLTDIVKLTTDNNLENDFYLVMEDEVHGINDRKDLCVAQEIMQRKIKARLIESGVTIISPDTSYIAYDFIAGRDVTIYPNVFIGEKVRVGNGVIINSFSHLAGSTFNDNVLIGPFARTRPGTVLGNNSKIGNFVEVKNSKIEENTKINHLSYIGDAFIGSNSNIGAGTITCNFDGISKKSQTHIGSDVSVGSNSCLVAPIVIGDGAFIAAGSVITRNVSADELAFGRAKQVNLPEKAKELKNDK